MADDQRDEGWTYLGNARKLHYFTDDGRSLCHKWLKVWKGGPWVDWMAADDQEKCAVCRRKLAKRERAQDIAYAKDIAETEAAQGHLEPWPPEPG